MAEFVTKLPIKNELYETPGLLHRAMLPMDLFRREIERLFSDFDMGFWPVSTKRSLLGTRMMTDVAAPVVDIADKDGAFEIHAEFPGVDEKDVEVKLVNNGLLIRGEKRQEKEEKKTDYVVSERSFGTFERFFSLPEGVDRDKIEAKFVKGLLTVVLPKTAAAKAQEKTITVKAA